MLSLMKKTILVVENNETLTEIYDLALTKAGFNVVVTNDGTSALDYLTSKTPDLVILDLKLPDIDGLKILEEIKKLSRELPIILCTAKDKQKVQYEIESMKIIDHLVKPVVLKNLIEEIKSVLVVNEKKEY